MPRGTASKAFASIAGKRITRNSTRRAEARTTANWDPSGSTTRYGGARGIRAQNHRIAGHRAEGQLESPPSITDRRNGSPSRRMDSKISRSSHQSDVAPLSFPPRPLHAGSPFLPPSARTRDIASRSLHRHCFSCDFRAQEVRTFEEGSAHVDQTRDWNQRRVSGRA